MSNQLSINESGGLPDILSVGSLGEKDDYTHLGHQPGIKLINDSGGDSKIK